MLKRLFGILLALGVPVGAIAAIGLVGNTNSNTYTPDQINAALNYVINQVNTNSPTCTTTGCASPGASASPVVTGTCATAGAGAGFAVKASSNAFSGSITCGSTANTQAIITWAAARAAVPDCTFVGTTGAIVTATSTTTVLTLNYASVASNVLSYICIGQ